MKGLHFGGPQDYLALLVRRKWWVLFPFLALSSFAILLTSALPKMFVSETLILIRPRDVPEDFVKDLIAGSTEQRLTAIQQTVLSRTNLVAILHEFEDKLPEYKNLNMDERVLKLNGQIKVQFEEKRGSGPASITYFRISYQNRNPELAQKIAAKLTSLFIEQDNRARETQVFGTTEFLAGELEKVADQLKQSDAKLKNLKATRRYELPDQLETNLRTLDRLGLQKQANAEALDRTATMQLNLERMIAETDRVIPRQTPRGATLPGKNSALGEYRQKKLELDQLSLKYKASHPEVQAATLQLERLKNKIPPEELALLDQPEDKAYESELNALTQPNPAHQNLTSQLEQVKTEFEIRERERKNIEADLVRYTQRVQATPQSEQEIAEVARQNTDLMKQYDKLKNDLAQAKLSESLESRQKGSQFVIVDPANYPLIPTKPSKPAVALGGLVVSLLLGIAIAVVVDIAKQKLWTQSEIEGLLGATVLVEIPEIVTDADVALARRKRITFVASCVGAAMAYSIGLYFLYLHQASVLRHLDPVLQKLYS
jgi:polysaccharide chain length determinant protein (PEP-CTERM system associated)